MIFRKDASLLRNWLGIRVAKASDRGPLTSEQSSGGAMEETSMTQRLEGPGREHGFSMIQVIVILALVSIVTAFGAIGVVNARAQMRLNSSVRQFASWAEKVRGDSVRRHA